MQWPSWNNRSWEASDCSGQLRPARQSYSKLHRRDAKYELYHAITTANKYKTPRMNIVQPWTLTCGILFPSIILLTLRWISNCDFLFQASYFSFAAADIVSSESYMFSYSVSDEARNIDNDQDFADSILRNHLSTWKIPSLARPSLGGKWWRSVQR